MALSGGSYELKKELPMDQLTLGSTVHSTAAELNRLVRLHFGSEVINSEVTSVGGKVQLAGSALVYELSAIEDRKAAHFALLPDVVSRLGLAQLRTVSGALPHPAVLEGARAVMAIYLGDGGMSGSCSSFAGGGGSASGSSVGAGGSSTIEVGRSGKAEESEAVGLLKMVFGEDIPTPITKEWLRAVVGKLTPENFQMLVVVFRAHRSDMPSGDGTEASARAAVMLNQACLVNAIERACESGVTWDMETRGSVRKWQPDASAAERPSSFKLEVEFQQAQEVTRKALSALSAPMHRFPQSVALLQGKGLVVSPLIPLEELGKLLPGAMMGFHQSVKQHEFALMLLEAALSEVSDHADRARYEGVLETMDMLLCERIEDGTVNISLSPFEAAVGFIPAVAVAMALLSDERVAFRGPDLPAVMHLYATAAGITFVDASRVPAELVLGPAVTLLRKAWQGVVQAAGGGAPERLLNVKVVCESLAEAFGKACAEKLDFVSDSAGVGSFRALALAFLRDVRARTSGDPNVVIPISVFTTAMRALNSLSMAQQRDEADLAAVVNEVVPAYSASVFALTARIQANIAAGGVGVNAVVLAKCTFTPGCPGNLRSSDPFCEQCEKWSASAWVCPVCKRVAVFGGKCFDFFCPGERPGPAQGPLPASAVPGPSHIAKQKYFYARRAAHEAARSKQGLKAGN